MAQYPNPVENREELNLRLGIKSSLYNLRSIVASLYSMYIATNKTSHINYTQEFTTSGITSLKMQDSIRIGIDDFFGESQDISGKIEMTPLFKAQIEALQVGLELFFHLAKVSFCQSGLSERTGSNRYNKCLDFSTNLLQLDLLLSSYPESEVKEFLVSWIGEKTYESELENKVLMMLSVFSEDTQCKIRTTKGTEVYFQREGIYQLLTKGETVVSEDAKELVGPYRILKSYISSGMHPFIQDKNKVFQSSSDSTALANYAAMVSTMLDLSPRRQMIIQEETETPQDVNHLNKDNQPHQQIYYGAPGTGKSHEIKKTTDTMPIKNVFRTTFHPDSDYSTFVGCYKPTMASHERLYNQGELISKLTEIKKSGVTYPVHKFSAKYWESLKELTNDEIKAILTACGFTDSMNVEVGKGIAIGQELAGHSENKKITYEFVPQAFLKAYKRAYETDESVVLVIEEINRGNCAQIFGDLFQLLDRKNGVSEYPIDADEDLRKYLIGTLGEDSPAIANGKLCLPSNLYIWATMNTSDQSLFPIDSAFKRRWEWKYVPINTNKEEWSIEVNGNSYSWSSFLELINEQIGSTTSSEDKKLGFYFCKADGDKISAERFVSKVLFYLYNDVFKDYGFDHKFFKDENNKTITFQSYYNLDGTINESRVELFLNNLGVDNQQLAYNSMAEDDEEPSTSTTKALHKDYWAKLLDYANQNTEFANAFGGRRTPSTDHWYNFNFNQKDCHFAVDQLRSKKILRVSLWFDQTTARFFKLRDDYKEQIESEMGISFVWDEKENKKASSIYYERPTTEFDEPTQQKEQFDFIIDMLLRMRATFTKYLDMQDK